MIYKNGIIQGYTFNEPLQNIYTGGSAAISTSGIASGFSTTSYVRTGLIMPSTGFYEFEIKGSFETASTLSISDPQDPLTFSEVDKRGLVLQMASSTNSLRIFTTSNGTSWISAIEMLVLSPSTKYYYKIVQDSTKCYCYVGTDKDNLPLLAETTNRAYFPSYTGGSGYRACLGYRFNNTNQYWRGTIDINDFSIKVDGKYIFLPRTSRPTISKYQVTANDFYEI